MMGFDNCTLCCRALTDGGAIFVSGNGATLTNVTTSSIVANTAQVDGGACSFNGGATVLAGNRFERNWAGSRGGAIAYTYQCFVPGDMAAVMHTRHFPVL